MQIRGLLLALGLVVALCSVSHALPVPSTLLRAVPSVSAHASSVGRGTSLRRADQDVLGERLRGGSLSTVPWDPEKIFNAYLGGLALTVAGVKVTSKVGQGGGKKEGKEEKSKGFLSLQRRFVVVFWLWKLADWMHGPYFYEVYASKFLKGRPMSQEMIGRMFLCGFASSMLFGTFAGSLVDGIGRKAGCMAFAIMYTASALITRSNNLWTLVAGRVLGGTATSLLFSAPEAWLVGEHEKDGYNGAWLGDCFELAYFGDGIMAILAGKLAGAVAGRSGGKGAWLSGPTAPFELSVGFLVAGAVVVSLFWRENHGARDDKGEKKGLVTSMGEAAQAIWSDKKILLTGAVQSLFEGAMYIFVLQWPPAYKALVDKGHSVPFGTIFSCFMTACMLGSSLFGVLLRSGVELESFVGVMLGVGSVSLLGSAWALVQRPKHALHILSVCFFAFETCVGLYFPSIGTLRSKYVPNSHKSAILNLFRIPLNLIVISTFLTIDKIGMVGALQCASVVLGLGCLSQMALRSIVRAEQQIDL